MMVVNMDRHVYYFCLKRLVFERELALLVKLQEENIWKGETVSRQVHLTYQSSIQETRA